MPTIDIFRLETDYLTFKVGQTIFNIGDSGDMMYAVIDGDVKLSLMAL